MAQREVRGVSQVAQAAVQDGRSRSRGKGCPDGEGQPAVCVQALVIVRLFQLYSAPPGDTTSALVSGT